MNETSHTPRKIILIDFFWTRDQDPRIPLGHASILASLQIKTNLHVCSITIPVNKKHTVEDVTNQILRETLGMLPSQVDIAFGAYIWGENLLQQVLGRLRTAGFLGRIILGGPQISYSSSELETLYPEADVFIRGYGEQVLCELAITIEKRNIIGVHWAGKTDQKRQANVELEHLPSPWLNEIISLEKQEFVRWETQRGCQFRCAFCQHREAGSRLKNRFFKRTRIEAEIELFCQSNVKKIAVLDPIFNMRPDAVSILEAFTKRAFKGHLSFQCRAETMTEEFLIMASKLDVCLEFGLQTIHRNEGKAIERQNNIKKIDRVLTLVRELNINHEVSLIFGLPLQTLDSFKETIQWCLKREIPVIKAFPLLLLRGTKLEQKREQWQLRDIGRTMPIVIKSSSFCFDDWKIMMKLSEALKQTENRHPKQITELSTIAHSLKLNFSRWIPVDSRATKNVPKPTQGAALRNR